MKRIFTTEPEVSIGLIENRDDLYFILKGSFTLNNQTIVNGLYHAQLSGGAIKLFTPDGSALDAQNEFIFVPGDNSTFVLKDVTIGIEFHWQRQQDQLFSGSLKLVADGSGITAVNIVSVETYLRSVISSEMSASCPLELLKAHGIISRSWLYAQSEETDYGNLTIQESEDRIIRWYDRDKHSFFDFCADDHCQRYQGMGRVLTSADRAINETYGLVLTYGGQICDARYSKCCGGFTESFKTTWQPVDLPYLTGVVDSECFPDGYSLPLSDHEKAKQWITTQPPAYCNVENQSEILKKILPSFDQETKDFYRWTIHYNVQYLSKIIKEKSGIDFGILHDLIPVERGESGRITELKIVGEARSIVVGKELEIRKWLSPQHLYSSAFTVETERDTSGKPKSFMFRGAGWGHGVGLCQIGAAMMAYKGKKYDEILSHYFPYTVLKKLY